MILIRIIKKLEFILEHVNKYILIQKYNLFYRFFQPNIPLVPQY